LEAEDPPGIVAAQLGRHQRAVAEQRGHHQLRRMVQGLGFEVWGLGFGV